MLKAIFTIFCFSFMTQAVAQREIKSFSPKTNNDTFSVYFDLNIPELNKGGRDKIDSLIYLDKLIPGSNIMIIGYADYLGSEGHNQKLSEQRAKNVEDYLLAYNFRKENITICIGKGEVERAVHPKGLLGYPTDRKVDIAIVKKKAALKKKPIPVPKVVQGTKPITVTKFDTMPSPPPVVRPPRVDISDVSTYKTGQTIRLRNIYFLPQRHTMTKESLPELMELFDILKANPNIKIQIEGHVCCIKEYPDALDMDNDDNYLSVNRAKAVYDFLVKKGIDSTRLKYAGFGRSRPIIDKEESEAEANINRRVEIRVLEK